MHRGRPFPHRARHEQGRNSSLAVRPAALTALLLRDLSTSGLTGCPVPFPADGVQITGKEGEGRGILHGDGSQCRQHTQEGTGHPVHIPVPVPGGKTHAPPEQHAAQPQEQEQTGDPELREQDRIFIQRRYPAQLVSLGLQNETTQLRYLEETATRLRQNGFTVEPIEDHHLPVCWEKGRLCRISGKGSVLYRQECVDSVRAQDALQTVIDTVKMTSEYMAILENAPRLKASGLHGDYRVLADFGSAVLAGHPTECGVQFVTWEWDFDREGVHHGHYFQDDYDAAY